MSEGRRSDKFGVFLGALIFLVGIALLGITFFYCLNLFTANREELIQRSSGDVYKIGSSFAEVILRIGVLLVMSIIGSMVSRLGIKMYLAARAEQAKHEDKP